MTSGYRNAAGVDFDSLFQAGTVAATGFRRAGGGTLQYAARGSATKVADVGFRTAAGVDLSELWLPLGAAPPVPGFNGETYVHVAQAPSGGTATVSSTVTLQMNSNGTWAVIGTRSGSTNPGTTTLASGTWLPSGQSAADYTIQFIETAGGGGSVVNGASTAQVLSTSRSFQVTCAVDGSSTNIESGSRTISAQLVRIGAGGSAATVTLTATAIGQI